MLRQLACCIAATSWAETRGNGEQAHPSPVIAQFAESRKYFLTVLGPSHSQVDLALAPQGGRAANQIGANAPRKMARSRWSLIFVSMLTIFKVGSTVHSSLDSMASNICLVI